MIGCFINQKEFKENHNFFYLLIKTLTTFIVKGLNSRINNLKPSFLPCPLNIHLNQLPQYCFLSSTFKDINELAQTLYVFRHLQNSIFDHLKYTQCFIDLNNFKSSLVSYELDSLKQLSNDPVTSILALNKKLILGKTPTCILSICKWGDTKGCSALHRLKLYGKNLSYRLLCSEKLENPLVFTIIRNLGMHVNQELRQIAFATIRRDVRETLLIHLEHVGRISKKEKNDIDFLRSLEAILPNQSYSSAKQRSWFQALRKPKITLPIDKSLLNLTIFFPHFSTIKIFKNNKLK